MYTHYGTCFKIGSTNDINKRINSFITSYATPPSIKFTTANTPHYKAIEKKTHALLHAYRLTPRREFFTCDLDTIISTIKHVEQLTPQQMYTTQSPHAKQISHPKLFLTSKDILNAPTITDDEYLTFQSTLHANNPLTVNDHASLIKHKLTLMYTPQTYDETFVEKHWQHAIASIMRDRLSNMTIDDAIQTCETMTNMLHHPHIVAKCMHALHLIKLAGYTSLKCENKVKLDYEAWFHYIKENELELRVLFKCKKLLLPDEYSDGLKRSLSMYVGPKIRNTLSLELKKQDTHKNSSYMLQPLSDADAIRCEE